MQCFGAQILLLPPTPPPQEQRPLLPALPRLRASDRAAVRVLLRVQPRLPGDALRTQLQFAVR